MTENLRTHRDQGPATTRESGQVSIFVLVALGFFLLGFVGFAVDMTNLWFHRQTAQGAADAACTAGIMDMLVRDEGGSVGAAGNFPTNAGFDCAGSTYTPCQYAALNGYNGAGLSPGAASNDVYVSFPSTVPNPIPPSMLPPTSLAPVPYLQVDVTDQVRLTFASIISRNRTSDVRARAICGITLARQPIPLIILNDRCAHSLDIQGGATVAIAGGPKRSVQVNSNSTYPSPSPPNCAAATQGSASGCTANGVIDLSLGGPNFTGSDFGTYGGQSPAPPRFLPGSTGTWTSPAAPISDPFQQMAAPPRPGPPQVPSYLVGTCTSVPCAVGWKGPAGCPDHSGCLEYTPGLYTAPIVVKNVTAIFDPGIYYLAPLAFDTETGGAPACADAKNTGKSKYDFAVDSLGIVRPSTWTGDNPTLGTVFYLSSGVPSTGYGSVFFGSSAGNSGTRVVDPYVYTGNSVSLALQCPGGPMPNWGPSGPPGPMTGNALLAPCSGTYGDPLGQNRNMLFFQDRSNNDLQGQPALQGGGGFILAGAMYFHNCPEAPNNLPCKTYPTDYKAFLTLQGNPGSTTQVEGEIVVDQLTIAGNATVSMVLNPNLVYNILKATLLD